MSKPHCISIERAKALAARWEAQFEEHQRTMWIASRFADATPSEVIRMWETGRKERGQKLTQVEVVALVERWLELFGAYPPGDTEPGDTTPQPKEPVPEDDTMLDMHDVTRMTGLSESTIKRMFNDGRFPKPIKPSPRRIGWPAGQVKDWLRTLQGQSRSTRQ
ncbi:MAG TPA: AlpA family phage regulatory protein [Hyphomicrobiaceae bacterium]|jgi:prophage regulatory protein|nr:AlpA family phage regulatory protein [Hyphomicrobiaceae bacterium]